MPSRCISPRPASFQYESIAELYRLYADLFLGGVDSYRAEIVSTCGTSIVLMDRHFFHLAGVRRKPNLAEKLNIQTERPIILAATEGFGPYEHDASRAVHLPASLDCLLRPDAIFEPVPIQDATLAFFKNFGRRSCESKSCVIQVMVGPSEIEELIPLTAFQLRISQARSRFSKFRPIWHSLDEVA